MRLRLISSIVLIPIAIVAIIWGGWWLFALFGVGILLAGYEYFGIVRSGGYAPLWIPALVLIAALLLDALLQLNLASLILVIGIAIPPFWELTRSEHNTFLLNWALALLGVLYIGVLGAHLFMLRNLNGGAQLLGITLIATWTTDILAYSTGRLFGRHPFFPSISPKKTREGAIGGIVCGTLMFGLLASIYGIQPWLAVLGGLGLALICTGGDLVESLIKRNLGVKDSGTLIAGHGGVLDRLDSMFFTVPFAFYFFTAIMRLS